MDSIWDDPHTFALRPREGVEKDSLLGQFWPILGQNSLQYWGLLGKPQHWRLFWPKISQNLGSGALPAHFCVSKGHSGPRHGLINLVGHERSSIGARLKLRSDLTEDQLWNFIKFHKIFYEKIHKKFSLARARRAAEAQKGTKRHLFVREFIPEPLRVL